MDIAIEYQAKLLEVRKMLKSLNDVGIKGESYNKRINLIEENVKNSINEYKNIKKNYNLEKNSLKSIYIEAISNLDTIIFELKKYSVYIEGYHYCEYLEIKANNTKLSNEEVKRYAETVIILLNNINNSDTREYEEEKEIVEKIYSLAYQIMKLEFIYLGKSIIFDYIKQNKVSEILINNEIEKEIESLPEEKLNSNIIKTYISKVKSSGISYSYIDKVFITMLALNDEKSIINKIQKSLKDLYKEFKNNESKIVKELNKIEKSEASIKFFEDTIIDEKKDYNKYLVKGCIPIALTLSLLFGCYFVPKKISTSKNYKTSIETYYTKDGYSEETSYQKKTKDFHSIYLYEYNPFHKNELNNYIRTTSKYDLSNFPSYENLEDYLSVDLNNAVLKEHYQKEKRLEEMTEEDFYDEVLYKVVRTIQDPKDIQLYYEKDVHFYLSTLCYIIYLLLIFPLTMVDAPISTNINEALKHKKEIEGLQKDLNEVLLDMKKSIEVFRRLCANNEEIKERFTSAFNTYKDFISSEEFNSLLEELNTKEYKLDLDSNTSKTLKKVK